MTFRPFPFAAATALVAAVLLPLPEGGKIAGLPSICPFFNFMGLPCPGCGLTRSWVCLAHGKLAESFAYHPLGPISFSVTLCSILWVLFRPDFQLSRLWEKRLFFSISGVFLAFWALRLGGVFPMP